MQTITKRSRLTVNKREQELKQAIVLCFSLVEDAETQRVDVRELANRSRLSTHTIYRLMHGKVSRNTRVGTLQALGYACGLRMSFEETGVALYLHE